MKTKPLKVISDERGYLMEILRADEPELFTRFGQVYVSADEGDHWTAVARDLPAICSLEVAAS